MEKTKFWLIRLGIVSMALIICFTPSSYAETEFETSDVLEEVSEERFIHEERLQPNSLTAFRVTGKANASFYREPQYLLIQQATKLYLLYGSLKLCE